MATSKKSFWYILVLTNGGPTFVTGYGTGHKEVLFEKSESPMELSKEMAMDIAFGLTVNGWSAFAVCSKFELDRQPYRYDLGKLVWQDNEKKEANE